MTVVVVGRCQKRSSSSPPPALKRRRALDYIRKSFDLKIREGV